MRSIVSFVVAFLSYSILCLQSVQTSDQKQRSNFCNNSLVFTKPSNCNCSNVSRSSLITLDLKTKRVNIISSCYHSRTIDSLKLPNLRHKVTDDIRMKGPNHDISIHTTNDTFSSNQNDSRGNKIVGNESSLQSEFFSNTSQKHFFAFPEKFTRSFIYLFFLGLFCFVIRNYQPKIISEKISRKKVRILSCFVFVEIFNLLVIGIFFKLSVGIFFVTFLSNIFVIFMVYWLWFGDLIATKQYMSFTPAQEHSNKIEKANCKINPRTFYPGRMKDHKTYSTSVSIVGISCRFGGGVNSKDDFWDLLVKGGSVIASYPENRLESLTMKRFYNPNHDVPGKHYTLKGAFLDEISKFDAQFFGISPAECRAMDPQQRLLLQHVYEAVEDAGLKLEDLQKLRTGVYVGLMNLDYGRLLLDDDNVPNIDEFASTGITASTVANRISFSLDLHGPSLTVDTACSSSLSALNIAVTHLQADECDVAIVCAPNLILARYFHTACCRTGLLADDGRCKSFDAKGDGYGRGEGVAVVILKPTHVALQDNDELYADILACGLNNDGQTAIPMTAPSNKMQAELAHSVLKESGLRKTDIHYVETHGTGTAVGDVIEMRSVSKVYANTSIRVLRIGSVKSNINHTESTAGLAGLIKVCLMIKYAHFVPTVNVSELKPQLKIAERKMSVQTKYEPWTVACGQLRTAAVCSYGYGGANAHVIVRESQSLGQNEVITPPKKGAWVLTLSARSREALRVMAGKFSKWLEEKSEDDNILKANVCYSLNSRRSVHSHRIALPFMSFKQASYSLRLYSQDSPGWPKYIVANNDASSTIKKLAFVFGGQGNIWSDMASDLMQHEPRFQESILEIDEMLERIGLSCRLCDLLMKGSFHTENNVVSQMALFATHYGMTQLLKSWGIIPSSVIGHSLGEISAAFIAHIISLEEAVQLILLRSKLHEACSPNGRMLVVGMSMEDTEIMLRSLKMKSRLSIAAVNSPSNVVLSGDQFAVEKLEEYLYNKGMFYRRLGTNRAFHSHEVNCVQETFKKDIEQLKLCPGMKIQEKLSCSSLF